jgi:broad specificity phosphatase PhoE
MLNLVVRSEAALMSSLFLIRHGQASFHADDYDQLSEVGRTQARLLGEYWARRGLVFDEVYTGPRWRQRETALLACAAYRGQGACWPEAVQLPEYDEYDLDGLIKGLAPKLAQEDPAFAELVARYQQSGDPQARVRNFQKAFERLTGHWIEMTHPCLGLESWPTFRARVQRGLRHIQEQAGHGRRVALFTSGGFIGAAVQFALAAPDRTALEVNWRVRNGSLTEFVFTRDRLTLDSFNAIPHLESPDLWTYR